MTSKKNLIANIKKSRHKRILSMCQICCTDTDSDSSNTVTCPTCQSEACYECNTRYITGSYKEAECMFCHAPWSRDFVLGFPKANKKVYLEFLGRFIREQERDMLPGTQQEATVVAKIRELRVQIHGLKKNDSATKLVLQNKISAYKDTPSSHSNKKAVKVVEFIYKCPQESCRGFVSSDHTCGTCQCHTCGKCRNPSHEPAPCNKDDVQSVNAIESETRPCPKCYTNIFKASGCDQIFCTSCHVVFDYRTGEIETKSMHNPQFFEWLADNPMSTRIDDIACGDLPGPSEFIGILMANKNKHIKGHLMMYQRLIHIQDVVLPQFQEDRVKENVDLRIAYLLNEFDDDRWAFKLVNRERRRMKIRAFRELLDTSITIIRDLLRQALYTNVNPNTYNKFWSFIESTCENIIAIHGGAIPASIRESVEV